MNIINLIHSTMLKLEDSDSQHEYFINDLNKNISLNKVITFSIGHFPNSILEKDFHNYLGEWVKSGFQKPLDINNKFIKNLLLSHGIDNNESLILISN